MRTLTKQEFIDWAKANPDVTIGSGDICGECPVARFAQDLFKDYRATVAMGSGAINRRHWHREDADFVCDMDLYEIEDSFTWNRDECKRVKTIGEFCAVLKLF